MAALAHAAASGVSGASSARPSTQRAYRAAPIPAVSRARAVAPSFSCSGSISSAASLSSRAERDSTSRRATVVAMASSAGSAKTDPSPEILNPWKTADAVCFDVDSTVCLDEGIDELAAFLGKGAEVTAWTTKAMDGGVTFQEALGARLGIMQPSKAAIDSYLAGNPPKLSPGMKELVAGLQARGTSVYLVSGGFRQMINPVAGLLNVPLGNVHANLITHDEEGNFKGFDETEFTCRSGGKAEAVKHLKATNGYKTVIMIGDGATDLEARMPGGADGFVGYGGVTARDKVMAGADWFVYDFERLIAEL